MNDLPDGWVESTLGKVVEYGKVDRAEPKEIPANAWILELEDIERDSSRLLQRLNYSQRKSKSTKNVFKKEDILYGKLRPYLNKIIIADQDGYCTTEIIPIKPNDAIIGRFLFYWLKSPEFLNYVNSVSYGLNMPRLGTKDGLAAPIMVAPIDEQKRIAEKLAFLISRVDSCQFHLERVSQILHRFRQSVLAIAMSGRLTENWRNEKGISKEWKVTDVQSVAYVGTGSTPLRSNSSFYSSKGTPWITSAATGQPYINSAKEFVTKKAIKAHRLRLYPIGTVIVAMYGEGKTRGQVSELAIKATINQACAAIVVDEAKIAKKYLKLALQANYLEMRELAEGGAQPNLNLTKIKGFTFPLPSPEEQAKIVQRVEKLFRYAERLETRHQSTTDRVNRLTPSLLAKAFRGELVEQDPNDESAEKLLQHMIETRKTNEEKRKAEPRKKKEKKMRRKIERKSLYETLLETGVRLTPEDLFERAGFEENSIDEFYEELRAEIKKKRIEEIRQGLEKVYLKGVSK
jgi:type I restriction enzyme S subunit